MATYLALDYGEARIGLAIATDREKIALPLTVVPNNATLMQRLVDVIAEHAITDIVVGWPVSMSGDTNERTRATEVFIGTLTKALGKPVHTCDERFTTDLAKRQGAKGLDDAQAAAAILDSFLTRLP